MLTSLVLSMASISMNLKSAKLKEDAYPIKLEKTYITGYLTRIVDGVIVSETGRLGFEWVRVAIDYIIGRRYKSGVSVSLPCSIYPPHSYAGARCGK